MFDPNLPQENTEIDAVQMRGQLTGLKDLIDAVPGVTGAVIDEVNTLPPGDPATVAVSLTGTTLHFTFGIPEGVQGDEGTSGSDGPEGPEGPPGEVSQQTLDDAIAAMTADSSANSNGVDLLEVTVSEPPYQSEVQDIANKLDELISALRR